MDLSLTGLGFFSAILITILFTWLISKLLIVIASRRPYVYFSFCFTYALVIFILGLCHQTGYFGDPESLLSTFVLHLGITFFLIPKIQGYNQDYLNTVTTYNEYGTVTDTRSYISTEYVSGTLIKLGIMCVVSIIFALLYTYVSNMFSFLFFALEGGLSFYIAFMSFKRTFF